MIGQENKIKETVAVIAGPFALAAAALLAVLSLLEFFRRGFVSLFLDMRIVFAFALILLSAAIWSAPPVKRVWPSLVAVLLIVGAFVPVLWKLAAPYGRLGLVVFGCGIATAVLAAVASSLKPKV
jgi:hypothetical protein